MMAARSGMKRKAYGAASETYRWIAGVASNAQRRGSPTQPFRQFFLRVVTETRSGSKRAIQLFLFACHWQFGRQITLT